MRPQQRAHISWSAVASGSACTASISDRSARGASTRSHPNQSCADISASSARIRAGRSGCPGTSCARWASWRSQGEAGAGTRVRYGNGPSRRSRRRGRRGRRAVRRPLRRPRERERHADLGPSARRDRLLLGPGRARRGAGRRRLAPAPPGGHARRRARAGPPVGRGGPVRGGAGALPRIEVLEGRRAATLAMEDGAGLVLDDGRAIGARAVVLATGGAAALWSRTTNPPGSFGSGLLLARAAGAALADLEFAQFHPTAVAGLPGREGFLISEAVRGEGATLHGADGERFVDELAPRDAVARAIFNELTRTGAASVGLDMRGVDPGRFPNVVAALREAGMDPMRELVPVAPASHYVMGGIVTDLEGRAEGVPGLFAVGECACTGLHGANRLASNSLSECFVFGRRAALAGLAGEPAPGAPAARLPATPVAPAPSRGTREAMWRHAGLERSAEGLAPLLEDPHPLARLVAASALSREESRGAQARADFPGTDSTLDGRHTVVEAASTAPRTEFWS